MGIPIFSSPEPLGSQDELLVYPCSVVRRGRCRSHFSIIFFSETVWPIKFKFHVEHPYCVYTMFPAAPAAPFARNVACRGALVIYFSDFQDLLRFVTFYYVLLRYP